MITTHQVALEQAWRTPQFWFLWVVLCFNVTAGIGILEQASPMIQEMFKGKVTRRPAARRVRRVAEPVQHGGAFRLVVHERLHRPQGRVRDLSAARGGACTA